MSRTMQSEWDTARVTQPQMPVDPQAITALHAAYTAFVGTARAHRWTRDEMVTLGRLYVQAWGCVPNPWRFQKAYCLPDARAIWRAWGSYAAYYAALEAPSDSRP